MCGRGFPLYALAIGFLPLAGCGPDRPPMADVSGQVTYNGKALTTGTIRFWPEEGRQAHGEIGPDGRYDLTTFEPGDGVLLGEHRVTVEATVVSDRHPDPKSIEEEMARARQKTPIPVETVQRLVPMKFSRTQTSGLTATVTEETETLDFHLSSGSSPRR